MYTTSNDYARAQPKLGQVVPPYNSQKDSSVKEYFKFIGVNKTLGKTGQVRESYSVSMRACVCHQRYRWFSYEIRFGSDTYMAEHHTC